MNTVSFSEAFKYAYKNKNAWNFLWLLVPIYGWFLLGGYLVRIVNKFVEGNFSGLPTIEHGDDFKLGFFMFIKSLPLIIATYVVSLILAFIPVIGQLGSMFLSIVVLPMLYVNFWVKQTVASSFEFSVLEKVFDNFGAYLFAWIKGVGLGIVFALLSIVLVGLPGLIFTTYIFYGNFYGQYIGKKTTAKKSAKVVPKAKPATKAKAVPKAKK
jgi:hypothetical protein